MKLVFAFLLLTSVATQTVTTTNGYHTFPPTTTNGYSTSPPPRQPSCLELNDGESGDDDDVGYDDDEAGAGQCLTCHDLKHSYGQTEDKVYQLCLPIRDGSYLAVEAYCDMTNGGYTYISQIVNGSVSFNRGWRDYEIGFGTAGAKYSHWLGLQAMHLLTTQCGQSQARIELGRNCPNNYTSPSSVYEDFQTFKVGDSDSFYKLKMEAPSGTAGDGNWNVGINGRDGVPFSTYDADHDPAPSRNCAAEFTSGWWYSTSYCYNSKLTGTWAPTCQCQAKNCINWQTWHNWDNFLSASIKVRAP